MTKNKVTSAEVINTLGMEESPTGGGWFKHVHSDKARECHNCGQLADRPQSTSFIYLLEKNTANEWHRFSSSLIWSHLGGSEAELSTCDQEFSTETLMLNGDVLNSQPVKIVESHVWLKIQTLGDWSLVSCTHTSGFKFGQLEIAEPNWAPQDGLPKLKFPALG